MKPTPAEFNSSVYVYDPEGTVQIIPLRIVDEVIKRAKKYAGHYGAPIQWMYHIAPSPMYPDGHWFEFHFTRQWLYVNHCNHRMSCAQVSELDDELDKLLKHSDYE